MEKNTEYIKINLSSFYPFFYTVVEGYKTEQYLIKNYRYPNYGDIIDTYVRMVNSKLGFEPNYELAIQLTTMLDYYINTFVGDLKRLVKKMKVVDYKEVNRNIFVTVRVEYEE